MTKSALLLNKIRRACFSGSPREWNADELLTKLGNAVAEGWTPEALRAWAWEFRPYGSKHVTPGAYRMAVAFIEANDCVWSAPRTLKNFNANPEAYSHVR